MSNYTNLVAGENIYIEKKGRDSVIHCSMMQAPPKNLYGGYFKLQYVPTKDAPVRFMISNCIFRMNGKYYKLDDFVYEAHFAEEIFVYLNLSAPGGPVFTVETYDEDEEINWHLNDSDLILLYKITVTHSENSQRMEVDTFAAGGLVDVIFGCEGFLYLLRDGSINATVTRSTYGREDHFYDDNHSFYIPCFNPETKEGMNIRVPRDKGGVLEVGKDDNYYIWRSTGYPTESQTQFNTVSVNISVNSVYFS